MSPTPRDRDRRPDSGRAPLAHHSLPSRGVRRLGELSASSGASVAAATVSLAFLAAALLSSHAGDVLVAFEGLAAAVTLVMVFALQHSSARHQMAVQRKLDEILSALPEADTRLVRLEAATPRELDDLEQRHDQLRRSAEGSGS